MKILTAAQKGFTLIEIMIVVAIIGIIASIALPSYNDYVKSGMAAEATATLADARIQMEQCFQDNRTYAHLDCAAICTPNGTHFNYACSVARTAAVYTLKATGSGKMVGFEFSVDQSNGKKSKYDGSAEGGCWKTSKTSSC